MRTSCKGIHGHPSSTKKQEYSFLRNKSTSSVFLLEAQLITRRPRPFNQLMVLRLLSTILAVDYKGAVVNSLSLAATTTTTTSTTTFQSQRYYAVSVSVKVVAATMKVAHINIKVTSRWPYLCCCSSRRGRSNGNRNTTGRTTFQFQ